MEPASIEPDPINVIFESAAQHASSNVSIFCSDENVGSARMSIAGKRFDSMSIVVICDGRTLKGIIRIEDLFAADGALLLSDVMDREAPVVGPGIDQEMAAMRAADRGESALPVVDTDGNFVGVIPPFRLISILLAEHEEDLSRLGGFLSNLRSARRTSEETVQRRFVHRLPWLLFGLAGALLAADFVGWFESQIQATVMLAFFIPGIVYLADAVGTQTETIVVRGLSVGVEMRRMVPRELAAGFVIGLALAVIAGPIIWLRWGDSQVALVVGLAIFAACSTAAVLAMILPWILTRFGSDPAFGSGPLATVLQDLFSILIYFTIAVMVLG